MGTSTPPTRGEGLAVGGVIFIILLFLKFLFLFYVFNHTFNSLLNTPHSALWYTLPTSRWRHFEDAGACWRSEVCTKTRSTLASL